MNAKEWKSASEKYEWKYFLDNTIKDEGNYSFYWRLYKSFNVWRSKRGRGYYMRMNGISFNNYNQQYIHHEGWSQPVGRLLELIESGQWVEISKQEYEIMKKLYENNQLKGCLSIKMKVEL